MLKLWKVLNVVDKSFIFSYWHRKPSYKDCLPLRVEWKTVSDFYWLKTAPVPLLAPYQGCGVSFERFPRPWQKQTYNKMYLLRRWDMRKRLTELCVEITRIYECKNEFFPAAFILHDHHFSMLLSTARRRPRVRHKTRSPVWSTVSYPLLTWHLL